MMAIITAPDATTAAATTSEGFSDKTLGAGAITTTEEDNAAKAAVSASDASNTATTPTPDNTDDTTTAAATTLEGLSGGTLCAGAITRTQEDNAVKESIEGVYDPKDNYKLNIKGKPSHLLIIHYFLAHSPSSHDQNVLFIQTTHHQTRQH